MTKDLGHVSPDAKRRNLLIGGVAATLTTTVASAAGKQSGPGTTVAHMSSANHTGDVIRTRDGVSLYFKDWGAKDAPVVTLSHGWPLNSDSWENQAFFLASHGFRVITHDRRGHGRSSQPWDGNDMDHYADDLATVIDTLGLREIAVIGFSTGGGEVARYVGRHGTSRVSKIGLISAVPPLMVKTPGNPTGVPIESFDSVRAAMIANRSQLFKDIPAGPFYGFNRPGAKVSQGLIDAWWRQGMSGGFKNVYESVKAYSETDFTADLLKFDRPTLIIHGDDDQVVPVDVGARSSKKLVPHAILKIYPGAPHGLTDTHKDQLNQDLLSFLRS
ncbi:Non-heme chloroperoxidase [Paraburkholderia graminis C4D1M]|jgi:non-heme chloroperoxidase|uniref:Alpha/beta hydrolase fold n=1 Tax=Paraburkholderia graminis (strain ATCC 700544 / DSM 17151 / LMG 18924 / NCIMB 13744 / C4D1M) TaxID=396598 RepID=B1FV02_PARG4|nr:alpha/beta hydrolase [Paraburkholderia graminis]EDT12460.1 alpha/beta hydrolase fold [Paraburkholderia graminis C4D1M]CAB3731880.1 Non-heme chloroperoxidase [Paraburkholderia graminis C4D1M]